MAQVPHYARVTEIKASTRPGYCVMAVVTVTECFAQVAGASLHVNADMSVTVTLPTTAFPKTKVGDVINGDIFATYKLLGDRAPSAIAA